MSGPDFTLSQGTGEAQKEPARLVVVQGEERPAVDASDEPMVMTFPHLLVREGIAFLALSVVLVALSLYSDAPLEEIADPTRTPNPAKAPWYFLGLQELLHYYPPVVSGVLLPSLLIVALAVIPYFDVNLRRAPLADPKAALPLVWIVIAALSILFYSTGSQPVWPLIAPLGLCGIGISWGAFSTGGRAGRWLHRRSVPFWIFAWFLAAATALTVIGVFFRGPGWSFTLPWRDGIYR